ncbi:MAG TPA: hypothetical protein VIU81_02035 [Gaiellaceae bacterium]
MSARLGRSGLTLLVAVVAAALAAGNASPAADRPVEKRLSAAGLRAGLRPVRARVITGRVFRRLAAQPGAWGGTYTAKSGARVTIYSSPAYTVDQSVNQAAADYLDSLVHGPEISSVKIYLAPPAEVGTLCRSAEADGCYFSATGDIITIGEDTQWSTVEEVVTHEYGHHIANNRVNQPWPSVAYGTKRWATYEGICAKEAAGSAFPGDEGGHYRQNPGEAFAESYLHLNEVKLGVPETPWAYDPMFAPDAQSMAAIEQDVLNPWKEDALKSFSGRFSRRGQRKTVTFRTPLDGVFAVELHGPPGSTVRLSGPPEIKRLSPRLSGALVCGQRTVTAKLTAGGAGRFVAVTATP